MSKRLNLDSFPHSAPPLPFPAAPPSPLLNGLTKVAVREDTRQTDVAGAAAPGAVKHSVSRFSDHFWVPFGGKKRHARRTNLDWRQRQTGQQTDLRFKGNELPDDKRGERERRVQNVQIGGKWIVGKVFNEKRDCDNESHCQSPVANSTVMRV